MRKSLKLSFLFVILLAEILSANFVLAATQSEIVINEIAWMGTKVDGIEPKSWWRYEWLELYNNGNQVISLDGWKIELYQEKLTWSLLLEGVIQTQDYFLITASDKISPNFDLTYSNLSGKFINSGQGVILKDKAGKIMDSLDCFSYGRWFAGDNQSKQTMEKINPKLLGSNPANWQTSENPGGTPKAKNSTGKKEKVSPVNSITPATSFYQKRALFAAAKKQTLKNPSSLFILLAASIIAIFSGVIILFLKKKLKKID